MTEADSSPASASAPAPSSSAPRKAPISTFKALSTVSYADRIRPKRKSDEEESSAAVSRGVQTAVTTEGEGASRKIGESSGEKSAAGGPASHGQAMAAAIFVPAPAKGKGKSDQATEETGEDDAGWQAVPARNRTSKAASRKEEGGSRWGKRAPGAASGSGEKYNGGPSHTGSRTGSKEGWMDGDKNETSAAAALSSDSWRSTSNARGVAAETSARGTQGQAKVDIPDETSPKAESSVPQARSALAAQPNSSPPNGAAKPAMAEAQTAAAGQSSSVEAGSYIARPNGSAAAAAPPVNVWQARREEQRRTAAAIKTEISVATVSSPIGQAVSARTQATSQQPSGSSGQSGSFDQTQMPKPGQPYKTASAARPPAIIAPRDPTAWPAVQSSAVKTANVATVKGKDDAQSVVSSSEAPATKKGKTKWIPIPASQLDLTLDSPVRSKKTGGESTARSKRAANGPPERSEKSADARQPKAGAKAAPKTKATAVKGSAANGAAPRKAKDEKVARDNESATREVDAAPQPGAANGSSSAEQISISSGSIVQSEIEEGFITAEIMPKRADPGEEVQGGSRIGDDANALAVDTGLHGSQASPASETRPKSPNGSHAQGGNTRGGIPFRGQRGGMRGGRGGWRGGSSPSGNYTHGFRGRQNITSPGARSTSLPVSGNVSPHLLATYSNLPVEGQYALSQAQGYSYPVPYYSYGAAGYPMYPQEPSSYEQQMNLNSFGSYGPPPPMPVSVVPGLDPLRVRVLGQLEYYFGEQNLPMDFFLRQQMDSRGWIAISLVASFNRVKSLSTDLDMIKEVLKLSSVVEVRDDKVRLANGKHKAWILPDAAPSPFEEASTSEPSPPIYSGSGIITSDLPAETRDKIAGEVTRDVLRSGSSAVLDALSPPRPFSKQAAAPMKTLEEDEASGSATGTDNNTGHITPATSVDDESVGSKEPEIAQA